MLSQLVVTTLDGGCDLVADRQKFLTLEKQDLRLQQAPALELDAAQRHDKRVGRVDALRQQRGGSDPRVQRMTEGGEINQQALHRIRYRPPGLRQPSQLP